MRLFKRFGGGRPLLALALLITGLLAAADQMLSGGGQGGPPRPEPPIARKTEAAPVLNKEQQRLPGLHEIPDPRDPILLEPPHQVEDALTLVHGLNKVRMAGLDAPNRHAVCFSEDESLWACGLRARAALYNLIRGEVIACMRVAAVKGGPSRYVVRCLAPTWAGLLWRRVGLGLWPEMEVSTGPRLRSRSVRSAVCGPAGGGSDRLRREPDGLPQLRNGPSPARSRLAGDALAWTAPA